MTLKGTFGKSVDRGGGDKMNIKKREKQLKGRSVVENYMKKKMKFSGGSKIKMLYCKIVRKLYDHVLNFIKKKKRCRNQPFFFFHLPRAA